MRSSPAESDAIGWAREGGRRGWEVGGGAGLRGGGGLGAEGPGAAVRGELGAGGP